MNLLIPYVRLLEHMDPLFEEFTYGYGDPIGKKMEENLRIGDYVFFYTRNERNKYLTAYYVVDHVLYTREAIKDKDIMNKYKNPHLAEFLSGKRTGRNDAILFGNPNTSKILKRPILLDKRLAASLSVGPNFIREGFITLFWKELTDKDKQILLEEIKFSEQESETETHPFIEEIGNSLF